MAVIYLQSTYITYTSARAIIDLYTPYKFINRYICFSRPYINASAGAMPVPIIFFIVGSYDLLFRMYFTWALTVIVNDSGCG